MPVVRVQRINGTVTVNDLREQQVGTLVFGGATTVLLDATAFTAPGTYSIFKYTTFNSSPYATGQDALNARVTFTPPAGLSVSDVHGTDDTGAGRITVTLV
jgi:hypothetical protein